MDYKQILLEIKKGHIRQVYLLTGEEPFLIKQVENEVVNALLTLEERDFSLVVMEHDPAFGEIAGMIETVPFMGGKNVIVIRGTQLFKSGRKREAAEGALDNGSERIINLLGNMPEYSYVIFVTTEKADKRRKLYKAVEKYGAVVDFSPLKPREIRPWLVAELDELGKKMAPDAMEYVLEAVSLMSQVSLGFLHGEMEKIALYSKGRVISRNEVTSIMAAVPEISVFKVIDAVSRKQLALALELLEEQLVAGESALKILALLARQVRMMWEAWELSMQGRSSSYIAEELGLPSFIGGKIVELSRGFTGAKLAATLVTIAEADRKLKSGQADNFILEQIIIDICR
ncbi:MAG: polymerase delta subunit [Firmicutes bacterium]|nr:polymerase delta subunit [Bacillota bacterium]